MTAGSARELRFIAPEGPLYDAERALRWRVLRKPLGRPPGSEVFAFEGDARHLILLEGGEVTGCVLFHPDGQGGGRLFQMAVREDLHRGGRGAALVRHLEAALRADGIRQVTLHARQAVSGFYEALGYAAYGEPYEEVGLPHVSMRKAL